ncbi:MAG: hypothetical protein P1P65_09890 [Treponema sp.]
MESTLQFSEELARHIAVQREEFNKHLLPQLQQNYAALGSVVKILRTNLLKKGLVYDDPYKYDSRMTEIKVPDSDVFADSERATVIGSRLAQYQTMIDFLTNSYQFNCSFLTPQRIASILALNKTFQWSALSESSTHANTRSMAEICKSLHSVSDTLTGGLLRDSLGHLSRLDTDINKTLRQLNRLHREDYKLNIRNNLPEDLKVTQADIDTPIKVLKTIKKHLSVKEEKLVFYSDLVMEVLKEDYGQDSAHLQQEVLRQLNVAEKKDTKTNKQENMRPVLITGLRIIGTAGNHFEACLLKIRSNQDILYKARATIFSKLVDAFRKAFNMEEKKHEIVIAIKDPITNVQKKEIIIIEDFDEDLLQKIRIFKSLSAGNSAIQQRLTGMSNEQLLDLLNKYIVLCNSYLKTLGGIDDYYKAVDIVLRAKMKGIKIELTTIRNAVIKANQCRAEYNASVEEYANMKELGMIHE